ncbi:MAG: hypothetical protein EZS28_001639 [Streblomastix strix]|uniref:Uncharacterized protein n=1 Tax=Streblomastix strix TaxID=222440 RepID=A0A5J4X6K5_9EUKA|nr:MAG: hypothetical protein EZS28_001639 [Streblomastix strix]
MRFFSSLKNFRSKIFGGIKKVADWVAPTLHNAMGTLSGPVSMLHSGAGQIKGTIVCFCKFSEQLFMRF